MANTIRIKRRASGATGAPAALKNAELAFNEVDNILYYGFGDDGLGNANTVISIGGSGGFLTLTSEQTASGNKTFTGNIALGANATATTKSANNNSNSVATTSYVDFAVQNATLSVEQIEDAAAVLFTNGTHSGIAATYDDANSKINLDVADFTITLGGDLTGSATITNLGSATLNATIAANSVALGTDTTGDYVGSVAAGTGITLSNTGVEGGTFTVTNAGVTALTGTANEVEVSSSTGSVTVGLPSNVTVTTDLSVGGNTTISGNLTVNGTTVTVNSTTISVDDKNIELGSVTTPSNTTADGGGITLKGATDKTFNWVNATGAWTSSEDLNLLTGKVYEINGTTVLSSSALGTGVTGSSLTSVGTITTGVWNGTDIAIADGGTGASDAGTARTNLGLAIGVNVQAYDATLAALAGVATVADRLIYATGVDTFAVTTFTSFARTLLDDADATTARTTLGLGTISTQNSNNVSITGGSISSITLDLVTIDGGTF